ncbi:hypothetical protein N5P37_000139, partial [Trichoderma harzianum]
TLTTAKTVDCREAILLKDPLIYRESLKNDKGERASGTCEWILENEIYRSWLNGDEHCLWICGGPGKGKTMLSIFLTEELERKQHERGDDQDTTLLYFFCANGNENCNNAIAVLRGLAYQLLSKHPDISTSVASYFETAKHTENTLISPETLWMVFKTLLRAPKLGTVYCILDGLDECDEKSIRELVKQFRDFYSPSDHTGPIAQNLKLAIVSRKINGLEDFPKIRLDPDNDSLINEDIKRFISTAMQELSRRPGYDDDFVRDIENVLLRRSNGTFLWIGFVMKALLDMSTRMEVMDVLNALPQGLPAMYGRMLLQIKSSQRHIISTILKCVTIARRPMTLEELKTAVSLLCNTPIDSTQIMCDRIASCGPILRISGGHDTGTCSLVHQSARNYLLREEVDTDPILEEFRIEGKEAHTSLARICLACIETSDFRHKPLNITDASVLKKSPLLGYATKHWPEHARHTAEDLDFPKTFFQKKDDLWKHWWQSYTKARNKHNMTPLMLAAEEGQHSVVHLLLENGADVNVKSEGSVWGWTALELAATRGHLSVVQLLLANGADPELPGNGVALNGAAANGHADIVQLLLTKGAVVNSAIARRGIYTPLSLAAGNGHEATVRLLLANGANININLEDKNGYTALRWAANRGHEAIVRLLLANGADAKLEDEALFEASWLGRETIVQLLLENGADSKHGAFDRALGVAAGKGHEAIVRLLLAKSVHADIKYSVSIALIQAAERGHDHILRMLLENGADINARHLYHYDGIWYTALEMAAARGRTTTVQFLLANGAWDVSTKDAEKPSRTALDWAAQKGHGDIVQLLLANGVSRLTKALRLAMQEGMEAVLYRY